MSDNRRAYIRAESVPNEEGKHDLNVVVHGYTGDLLEILSSIALQIADSTGLDYRRLLIYMAQAGPVSGEKVTITDYSKLGREATEDA